MVFVFYDGMVRLLSFFHDSTGREIQRSATGQDGIYICVSRRDGRYNFHDGTGRKICVSATRRDGRMCRSMYWTSSLDWKFIFPCALFRKKRIVFSEATKQPTFFASMENQIYHRPGTYVPVYQIHLVFVFE